MGWWTWQCETCQDGELMLGDEPSDIIAKALRDIGALYREGTGREPRQAEIRATLEFCLGGMVDEEDSPSECPNVVPPVKGGNQSPSG